MVRGPRFCSVQGAVVCWALLCFACGCHFITYAVIASGIGCNYSVHCGFAWYVCCSQQVSSFSFWAVFCCTRCLLAPFVSCFSCAGCRDSWCLCVYLLLWPCGVSSQSLRGLCRLAPRLSLPRPCCLMSLSPDCRLFFAACAVLTRSCRVVSGFYCVGVWWHCGAVLCPVSCGVRVERVLWLLLLLSRLAFRASLVVHPLTRWFAVLVFGSSRDAPLRSVARGAIYLSPPSAVVLILGGFTPGSSPARRVFRPLFFVVAVLLGSPNVRQFRFALFVSPFTLFWAPP